MTNQQILEKAIKKAIDNGWRGYNGATNLAEYFPDRIDYRLFIFNHDFAHALWGEEEVGLGMDYETDGPFCPAFEKHLMDMVIAEDPIKYLGENLD